MNYIFGLIVFLPALGYLSRSPLPKFLPNPAQGTIYAQATYDAFPAAQSLTNGHLIVVFRVGSAHVSPDGKLVLARSTNSGVTWLHTTIFDDPNIDDRVNVGLVQLSNGSLILPFFQHNGVEATGSFVIKSADNGLTWSAKIPVASFVAYGKVIEEPNGTLLLPAYTVKNVEQRVRAVLLQSADGGNTWSLRSTIASSDLPSNYWYSETAVLRLAAQRYLAIIRVLHINTLIDHIYQATSDDAGFTWSSPQFLFDGVSPDLLRLNNGHILLTIGDRVGVTGIRGYISRDNGASWSGGAQLVAGASDARTNIGYPSSVQLSDGNILTAYYYPPVSNTDVDIARVIYSESDIHLPGVARMNSVSLNGIYASINIPVSASLNVTGPVTLEAWVKPTSITSHRAIIERVGTTPADGGGYILRLSEGKVRLFIFDSGQQEDLIGNTNLTTGVWHHVAGVADGTQLRVFVDGMIDGSKSSNVVPSSDSSTVLIGGQIYQNQVYFPFEGLIDEVRISAAPLYGNNFPPESRLMALTSTRGLWNFDNQSLRDSSGNGNDGHFVGTVIFSTDVPAESGPTPTPTPIPTPTPASAPILLTEQESPRAIALTSVTMIRDPFPLLTRHNFSLDQRTRIMLWVVNVELQAGEDPSVLTVQAEDLQHRVYALPVEYVGKVPNFDWLTQINVRLADELRNAGDLWVSVRLRGVISNKGLISIGPSP